MSERFPAISTAPVPERGILVGVVRPNTSFTAVETLQELERLATTAGVHVVAQTSQRLDTVNPRTFVGAGKAQEIADLCTQYQADVVIFDDELTPSQQSNLEKLVGRNVKIIDRTALILDIFALHATTKEGRLQVRLAQNQYLLPRLRGMWAHLASNRMGGGVGSRFGEGESQLEVDRRMVRNRITSIKRELKELEQNRDIQRSTRRKSGILRVALAGYTNAGKSSLLNALCNAHVLEMDQLFATLDSTTRKLNLPEGREITLTDTVGFIQKLPTMLVESFKSTLAEISEADIILHVIDASHEQFESQIQAVEDILESIGAQEISRLMVFNKIDAISAEDLSALKSRWSSAVCVSAKAGTGLHELLDRIAGLAAAQDTTMRLCIPYEQGRELSFLHERAYILEEAHEADGTHVLVRVPSAFVSRFQQFQTTEIPRCVIPRA